MGRSQETFNKKEKEKKKQKKRQDKQQKMEERKANPDKAKSFEDMLAYVDENGNISSTPPDPRLKNVVKLEDIEVSVSRQVPMEPEDLIRKGTVTFFNDSKGYGFIRDHETQESVFFHVNGLIDPVGETDKVTFEMEKGPKGMNAVRVKLQA